MEEINPVDAAGGGAELGGAATGAGGEGARGGDGAGGDGGGCSDPARCPGEDSECQARACNGGACGVANEPTGTLVSRQTMGDCVDRICDGLGVVVDQPNDADTPDDGNDCTADVCSAGAPDNPPLPVGTACSSSSMCDGMGSCVECVSPADCVAAETCVAGLCSATLCQNGVHDGAETDLDCGGPDCGACVAGLGCQVDADCVGGDCLPTLLCGP